eukprot:scaffold516_cov175-Amphora_coffeaeformis.AAC.19
MAPKGHPKRLTIPFSQSVDIQDPRPAALLCHANFRSHVPVEPSGSTMTRSPRGSLDDVGYFVLSFWDPKHPSPGGDNSTMSTE